MLRLTRVVLIWLNRLNWLGAALALAGVLLLLIPPTAVETQLANRFPDPATGRLAIAAVFGIVVLVAPCVHAIFTRLTALIGTAINGRPFVPENVGHLRTIGWALLAIQLLDLALGGVAGFVDRTTGIAFGWSPSLTGWLAVLLVFVLARVFATGAEMQDEVEATV